MIFSRKLRTQNPNKIASCLIFTLLEINEYGVTVTIMIKKSKTWLLLKIDHCCFSSREEVSTTVVQVITAIAVNS